MRIQVEQCAAKDLEDGLTCMDEIESEKYFREISLKLRFLKNYIDYEDIDSPIQSIDGSKLKFDVKVGYKQKSYLELQTHEFDDNITRWQLLGGDTIEEFLNVDSLRESIEPEDFEENDTYQSVTIYMGSKKVVH